MNAGWRKTFANPGAAYRGKPFWAWNGRMEPEELRRQVRIFREMGLGGFFMHSRTGLATPYLGREWFDCVHACIDEAKKIGLEAWLYDEDRWPSGAAGGLVTKNRKYGKRMWAVETPDRPARVKWDQTVLAVFMVRFDGDAMASYRRIPKGKKPPRPRENEQLAVFRVRLEEPSSWFNGQAYLDTLSHEAVRAFIRTTHEAYRKRCGREFGRAVPGIFTDEPHASDRTTAWTDKLPAVFRKRYGYDLVDRFPELVWDRKGEEVNRTRWHYHDCTTFLFCDAFARQIGEWCEQNQLLFTGHVLAESDLRSQTYTTGSVLRFYEHMQAPGMDLLTAYWREYDTAKQVASVARQFGRKWRLSEMYGCTGWHFPFAGHKVQGDWQAALGINLRCQHLAWYTMEGQAKRDFPASIFYQSPWWRQHRRVEDYFARLNVVLTRGAEVRDLLVIHPVESMWTLCRPGWRESAATAELDHTFRTVRDELLGHHVDFDYGDEEMLSRLASVRRAKAITRLRVGKAEYTAALVPPMRTIRSSTLRLLQRFREAGGVVVFAGDAPRHVDAEPSEAARELAARCVASPAEGPELADAVQAARRVSISGSDGKEIPAILYMLREDRDHFYLFACNTGHDFRVAGDPFLPLSKRARLAFPDVRICIACAAEGTPVELDAASGRDWAADARRAGGEWKIQTSFAAFGSRLFVIPKTKGTWKPASRPRLKTVRSETLNGEWSFRLTEANNLVLDRPRLRLAGRRWSRPRDVLDADRRAREALGVPRRGGTMCQPWARPAGRKRKRVAAELLYTFEADVVPDGPLYLAIEEPHRYAITVNGDRLDTDAECGWWVDRSLRTVPVDPARLRHGRNEILLACPFDEEHPGLEIVYLLGRFGVQVDGAAARLTRAPERLRLADWVPQGLAFYSGSVQYVRKIRPELAPGERLVLEIPAFEGVGVRALVDNREAGVACWPPYEIDLTEALAGAGEAELRIEVLGHRRNSHGPLHRNAPEPPEWTGPTEFETEGDQWSDAYKLVPCGLTAPPRLSVRAG